MFDKISGRNVYCYSEWQFGFEKLPKTVEIVKGLKPVSDDDDFFDSKTPTLLILDDLTVVVCNDARC